jgi:hypothetical protein
VLICKCEENQAGRAFVVEFLAENGRPRLIFWGLESRCVCRAMDRWGIIVSEVRMCLPWDGNIGPVHFPGLR